MTALVVMLEIERPGTVHELGGGEHAEVGRAALVVHAAPDVGEGVPGGRTFCGLETGDLQPDPLQPAGGGATWYAPRWSQKVCEVCAVAVRTF